MELAMRRGGQPYQGEEEEGDEYDDQVPPASYYSLAPHQPQPQQQQQQQQQLLRLVVPSLVRESGEGDEKEDYYNSWSGRSQVPRGHHTVAGAEDQSIMMPPPNLPIQDSNPIGPAWRTTPYVASQQHHHHHHHSPPPRETMTRRSGGKVRERKREREKERSVCVCVCVCVIVIVIVSPSHRTRKYNN
jgi:hypothetical protein